VDDATGRDVDDFDELCPDAIKSAAGCNVVRVTGNPYWVDLQQVREGKQQAKALRCVMMSSVLRVDRIADVACVSLDVRRRADPQTNGSEFRAAGGVNHPELVCRNPMDRLDSVLG